MQDKQVNLEPLRHAGMGTSSEIRSGGYSPDPTADFSHPMSQPSASRNVAQRQGRAGLLAIYISQFISMGLSLAIIAILARILFLYHATKQHKIVASLGLVSGAWPSGTDSSLVPIYILISAAAVAAVTRILTLSSLACSRRSNSKSSCCSILGRVGLSLAIVGLFAAGLALLKLHEGDNGLFGWSCSHRHVEVIFEHNDVGLGRVCDSMNAIWAMGIAAAALELITLILTLIQTKPVRTRQRMGTSSFIAGRSGYKELGPNDHH